MSNTSIQVRISQKSDLKDYLHYAVMALPAVILLFISFHFFFEEYHPMFTRFTYFLIIVLHSISLYLKLDSFTISQDSTFKRALLHPETHIIVIACALYVPSLSSIFTWTLFIIIEGLRCVDAIRQEVAPRAGGAKDSIVNFCNTVTKCEYIYTARAGLEIFLNVYFFFYALLAWNSSMFICFLIYLVGYTAYAIVADANHVNVYKFIDFKLLNLHPHIDQARKYLATVPDYCRIIYPIDESMFHNIKIHFD